MVRTILGFILLTTFFILVTVTAVSAQTPQRASGIDSLNNGGDLGGNTNPQATLVSVPKDGGSASTRTQRFTLSGRAIITVPRRQIIILRRRTPNGYVTEKKIMR